MCQVQLNELHDKSAAMQTPWGRQRDWPSVLPSISATLGQNKLSNVLRMWQWDVLTFLIYTCIKFLLKILFQKGCLAQLGLYCAYISVGDGRGKGKHRGISVDYQPCWRVVWRSKGASVLLTAFKVCACMCRVCSIMQIKWLLVSFCLFTWIELRPIYYFDIFIRISKLCAIFMMNI